ncbi:DUF192 domain-containing protein [Candidatus Uhrbacteria bacterium]|nr:DUF192 domain-containing protein [Candidatus Uhrbacteria bacterium]
MSLRETPNSTKDEVVITFPDGFQLSPLFADNEFEFKLGLSGQKEPISMLFLFENETLVPFWMKGMFFPIDIIWLDNQTIVGFETDVQVENPPMTIYRPPTPVDSVLEVPAGFVKAHNLGIGDQLDIDLGKE